MPSLQASMVLWTQYRQIKLCSSEEQFDEILGCENSKPQKLLQPAQADYWHLILNQGEIVVM